MPRDTLYNENELLTFVVQGDEPSFAKLFDYHQNRVYTIAYKLTHSKSQAEDIVQNVFLKIWLARANLLTIQDFSAYLFIVTRNDVYKVLKQIARNYTVSLPNEESQLPANNDTAENMMEKECRLMLQNAINRLPKQQKQVYVFIKEQGLKREEVADLLHLQPETVKFHLAQAMKNIRAYCMLYFSELSGLIYFLFL